MAKTKAKEIIRLSNGDAMSLREAIDAGRVQVKGVDEYGAIVEANAEAKSFTAWEVGADVGWSVGRTLALGYGE